MSRRNLPPHEQPMLDQPQRWMCRHSGVAGALRIVASDSSIVGACFLIPQIDRESDDALAQVDSPST